MTKREFKRNAERVFREGNPDATNVVIAWTRCNTCVWPGDGTTGWSGTMRVSADGYRTRDMIASYNTTTGFAVR